VIWDEGTNFYWIYFVQLTFDGGFQTKKIHTKVNHLSGFSPDHKLVLLNDGLPAHQDSEQNDKINYYLSLQILHTNDMYCLQKFY